MAEPRYDAHRLFEALDEFNVAFVVVGGVAVQAHGGQRFTQDLDLVVDGSRENFGRLHAALESLGARISGEEGTGSLPSPGLLASSDHWRFATPSGGIDVMTLPAHFGRFDDLSERADRVGLRGIIVSIAGRHDLIEMKRAAGRPQDLADVQFLESLDQS